MESPSVGVAMRVWRVARAFAAFVLSLVCVGCGDQFRPVATPIRPPASASLDEMSASNNAVVNNVTLQFSPIAMAGTPDGKKIYAVGSDGAGVGWAVSINSLEKSLNEAIPGLSAPLWVATRSDSQRAYVLNSGSGTVSTIDTFSDIVLSNVAVGAGANFMLYDPKLNRLYVTNPTAGTVGILDASTDPPSSLTGAPLAIPQYTPQTSSDSQNPCQGSAVVPTSITARPDGTRAYVASYQVSSGQICSQLSVINTANNTVASTTGLAFTVPPSGTL